MQEWVVNWLNVLWKGMEYMTSINLLEVKQARNRESERENRAKDENFQFLNESNDVSKELVEYSNNNI